MSSKEEDRRYFGMKLEEILHELKVIHEFVAAQPTRTEFNELSNKASDQGQDIKIIKAAVTGQSAELHEHDRRITRLEAA